MATIPNPSSSIDVDEWRRAVALMAAVDTHSEASTLSPTTRERNVLLSARKFETYLRDGQF